MDSNWFGLVIWYKIVSLNLSFSINYLSYSLLYHLFSNIYFNLSLDLKLYILLIYLTYEPVNNESID